MRLFAYAALAIFVAGCVATPEGADVAVEDADATPAPPRPLPTVDSGEGSAGWRSDCTWSALVAVGDLCARVFDIPGGRDMEAEIAVDVHDPRRVLLTWTTTGEEMRQAFAAFSDDAGATWTVTPMADPSLPPIPGGRISWDSSVGFLPDGTAVVLYAGEAQGTVDPLSRITLATTRDGRSWEYHRVAEDVGTWDYPDLGISPDDGRIYVTAYPAGTLGTSIWFWTSADRGETWSVRPLHEPREAVRHSASRISAGAGGLVMVSTTPGVEGITRDDVAASVTTSRDGGATFDAPTPVARRNWARTAPLIGNVTRLVTYNADGVAVAESSDDGRTWRGPTILEGKAKGTRVVWTVAAAAPTGAFAALTTFDSADPVEWSATLVIDDGSGNVGRLVISAPVTAHPAASSGAFFGTGDEYGGLAFSSDGSLWATWADARDAAEARVVVARFVRG